MAKRRRHTSILFIPLLTGIILGSMFLVAWFRKVPGVEQIAAPNPSNKIEIQIAGNSTTPGTSSLVDRITPPSTEPFKEESSSSSADKSIDLKQVIEAKRLMETHQEKLVYELVTLRKQVQALTTEKSQLNLTIDAMRKQTEAFRSKLDDANRSLETLKSSSVSSFGFNDKSGDKLVVQLRKLEAQNTALINQLDQKKSVEEDNAYLRKELDRLKMENVAFNDHKDRLSECTEQLNNSQKEVSRATELERKVVELTNEIFLMKTEVAIARGVSPQKIKPISSSPRLTTEDKVETRLATPIPRSETVSQNLHRAQPQPSSSDTGMDDMLVLEVTSDKANLRSAAGMGHSPVMTIQKGSRLVAEDRQGDWFRVISPNGSRAYIRADMVVEVKNESGTNLELKPKKRISAREVAKQAREEISSGVTNPDRGLNQVSDGSLKHNLPQEDAAFQSLKSQLSGSNRQ